MTSADADPRRRRGHVAVVVAAVAWSSAGPLQRLLEVDSATQVAGRALFAMVALFAYVGWSSGRRADLLRRLADFVRAPGRHDDLGAGGGQLERDVPADPAPTARDDRDLVMELRGYFF